ncbi:MAG: BrnT family toxin [Nitrospirae bacterium]|nr:BrnT family toxin [Nitrospirota bacterium]
MKFEWDAEKNRQNIKKHGIDFADAWQLFEHPLFVRHDDRYDYGEDRYIGLGMLKNMMVVFAAFVEKDGDSIRVISMRKAKKHERQKYEKAIKN